MSDEKKLTERLRVKKTSIAETLGTDSLDHIQETISTCESQLAELRSQLGSQPSPDPKRKPGK